MTFCLGSSSGDARDAFRGGRAGMVRQRITAGESEAGSEVSAATLGRRERCGAGNPALGHERR